MPWDDTSNWNAASSGVPWATPGGDVTGAPYATNAQVLGPADTITSDVTTLVSAWTSGALTDYGLLLAATPDDTLHFDTGSPRLTLNYTPTPEPTSAALLSFGTLLLAARRRRRAQV